jgi:hypothetical protein
MSKGAGSVGMRGSGFARVTRISQVRIVSHSGMRSESRAFVRAVRAAGRRLKPIVIVVEKGQRPHLQDGRHRLEAARAAGDKSIKAIVRYVGPRGAVRKTETRRIRIDG